MARHYDLLRQPIGEWVNYTPVWTAATTPPTLGDGILTGRYRVIGKSCHVQIFFSFGSTSNPGTGTWAFSLPFTCGASMLNAMFGAGRARNPGAGITNPCLAAAFGSQIVAIYDMNATTTYQAGVPFTWAVGMYFSLNFEYEVDDGGVSAGPLGTPFGRFVPLTAPLTSTAWDGDAYSTTGKTLIDLSAVFGVPAGVRGVLLSGAIRDSGSAGGDYYVLFGPNNIADKGPGAIDANRAVNDGIVRFGGLPVSCDANGDIYYQIAASGAGSMDIWLEIWGYWVNDVDPYGTNWLSGWRTWTPTLTGFSVDPTNVNYRYTIIGKTCIVMVSQLGNGTSNANTFTITAPIAAANIANAFWGGVLTAAVDNGGVLTTACRVQIQAATNTITLYRDMANSATWTASGGKRALFTLAYEID